MKSGLYLLAIVFSATYNGLALAYKEATHVKLSDVSASESVLIKEPSVLQNLGISSFDKFKNSKNKDRTILELIQDGADFEDANIRSLFHFFDPLHDEGLLFFTSPTWALEDKGKVHFLQNYSFSDARDRIYEALTLSDKERRKKSLGLLFESLGRVIHHTQDMAQPQHVRSDQHLDFVNVNLPFIETPSFYENYTNEQNEKSKLHFDTYAPVNGKGDLFFLTKARDFWHTETKNPKAGKGLAEFTNSNFVSTGTNFDTDRYPNPKLAEAVLHDENANALLESAGIAVPSACLPPNPPCMMRFYSTEVKDNYRPAASAVNPRTATESIFDQDLHARNLPAAFSLNRFNFDEPISF